MKAQRLQKDYSRAGVRWLVALSLLAAAAGCVAPTDFERIDQECTGERFDVPTRDRYCSGEVTSRRVALEGFGIGSAEAKIQVTGRHLATLEPEGEGQIRFKLHEQAPGGDIISKPEWSTLLDLPSGARGELTSAALMGVFDDAADPFDATVAFVHDKKTLSFVDVDIADTIPTPGDPSAPPSTPGRYFVAEAADAIASDRSNFEAGCLASQSGPAFEFADVTPIVSKANPCHRYLVVAARCGIVIYGKGNDGAPEVMTEMPIEAVDVEIDADSDRLMVASGAAGLKVRYAERVIAQLEERFAEVWPGEYCEYEQRGDLSDAENDATGGNNDSFNNDPAPGNNGAVGLAMCGDYEVPYMVSCQDYRCNPNGYRDIDCMDGVCTEGDDSDPDCNDGFCNPGGVSAGDEVLVDPDCFDFGSCGDSDCDSSPSGERTLACDQSLPDGWSCFDGTCDADLPRDPDCMDGECVAGGTDPDCRDNVCVEGLLFHPQTGSRLLDPDCIPEPLFDRDEGIQVGDPSALSHINVTRVGFSDNRVFYINSAVDTDGERSKTLLVSGALTPANTLSERTSVEIASDDLDVGRVDWEMVSLGESHFALLRRTLEEDGTPIESTTSLVVYDAPNDNVPVEVLTLELAGVPNAVLRYDGELWVVYPDFVEAYTITIEGEPR